MAQQFIDFGTFPNDPAADPIRAAFQKIQNNFTDLYNTQLTAGVVTLNVGPGLTTNSNVGNILLQTSFPNITIQTSNSLLVGVGAATSNTATISSFTTPFALNLAPTITTGNANFTVSTRTVNLNVTGSVVSTLNPNANIALDLGNNTNRWRTIYLGSNGISIGTRTINANTDGILIGNLFATNSTITNFISTGANITTANISNINVSGFITSNLIPNANVTYDLGNNTHRFKDLYLSGSTIVLGNSNLQANANGFVITNSYSNNIISNNITTTNADISIANVSSLNVSGALISSITPNANVTYSLGNSTNRFNNIFSNTIRLESEIIYANSSGVITSTIFTTSATTSSLTATTGSVGTLAIGNFSVSGYLTSSIIPSLNETFDLGNSTNRFRDLYLSGNSLRLGTSTVTADGTGGIVIQDATVSGNLNAGNITAVYLDGTITSNSQPNITTVGVLSNLAVSGNITSGSLSVVGNLEAANLSTTGTITAGTITGNIIVPPGANVQAPGSNSQILFNDGGNTSAVSGMTFNKSTNLLSISGNVQGGNIVTSGALSVSGNGTMGNLTTSGSVVASGNVNAANLITVGILASSANISGNVTTNGFLNVVGNASLGNITTTTLSGQVVSVSGNVSGANLVASGILRVDGNANVGNLTTSGFVSAATIAASANISAGNLSTTGSLNVTGNIVAGQITSTSPVSFTGNATLGNISAGPISVNGNITGATLMESGLLNVTGNMTGGNVLTNGFLSVAGTATVGNISTAGTIAASGALNAGSITTAGNLSAANGNISTLLITSIISASGAIANVGTVNSNVISVVGTATAGNLSTGGTLSVTGNATTGNLTTGGLSISGNTTIAGTITNISSNLNVTGNIAGGNANINNLEVASFAVSTANASNVNISGILSMPSSTANIGTVAAGIVNAAGNVSGSNLIASGYLAVSGNASANNLTVASGIVNNTYAIGGQITVGSNLQVAISGSSGNGSVATLTFTTAQSSPPFPSGSSIIVSGLLPSGFNGTYTVLNSSNTTVSYTNPTNAVVTQGGFVRSTGTSMVLQGVANVGGLVTAGDITGANVTGSTFTATLFSGNGASITGINMFNTGMRVIITATAGTGSIQTLSFASQAYAPFTSGQSITVSGVTPSGYNGTYTVISCTTTAVTMAGSTTGAMSVSGVITGGPKSAASTLSENVVNGSQPNITSVGTLTGLTLSGSLTGVDITSSGFMLASVSTGIAANGTSLSTATALIRQVNVVSSSATGVNDGVRLPSATVGMQIVIINTAANPVKVYPANGGTIDSLSLNTAFSLGVGARLLIIATATTQWYTMVGVYG